MEIRPDRKLLTKHWLGLLAAAFWIAVFAGILQLLIPLGEEATPAEVSVIVWPIAVGLVALIWIISVPLIVLWVKNLTYFIGDERITIHKGILTKIQQNIPYRAITDFMVHRSLFDRFLGIGSIRVQTAGQSASPSGYEGQLAGLLEWEALHEKLRSKLKTLQPVSAASTVQEDVPAAALEAGIQQQMLEELRAIRRAVERQ